MKKQPKKGTGKKPGKCLFGLLAFMALTMSAANAGILDRVWNGSAFYSEATVKSNNPIKIGSYGYVTGGETVKYIPDLAVRALTSNATLLSGFTYIVTQGRTYTLPSAPKVGDRIQLYPADNGTLATTGVTLNRGGTTKIEKTLTTITANGGALTDGFEVLYIGPVTGWKAHPIP
jgi:hypothetical protein